MMVALAGCSGAPSHVPPLWQLPGAAVSTAFGNAAYAERRNAVKDLIVAHDTFILREIDANGGPNLDAAMQVAGIPAERRPDVLAELRAHPEIYRSGVNGRGLDIEAVTVAFMVNGR